MFHSTNTPPVVPKRAPLVYNPKSPVTEALNLKKNPHAKPKKHSKSEPKKPIVKPKSKKDIQSFLRKREEENDDIDDEIFASKPSIRKKQSSGKVPPKAVSRPRRPQRQKAETVNANEKESSDTPSVDTINAIEKVDASIRQHGVDSTKENSLTTFPRKRKVGHIKSRYKEPVRLVDKFKEVFKKREKKHTKEEKKIPRRKRKKGDTEEIRERLVLKYRRRDRCTYACLVIIILIRLITTIEMVWEVEDYYMVLEHLKRLRKLNCLEIFDDGLLFHPWPVILFFYFMACCILPIITRKDLSAVCVVLPCLVCCSCGSEKKFPKCLKKRCFMFMSIVWLFIQMVYSGIRCFLFQGFMYHQELFLSSTVINTWIVHSVLDIISFITIMLRYYFVANPCQERDRFSNTMLGSALVNENIQFMCVSSLFRKKLAVQRATAHQIMTVVKKIKDKVRSGAGSMDSAHIHKEVRSAIHALEDWKKFAALRIIHAYEAKEKAMREKLKLRRKRIKEMKERFKDMMIEARKRRGKTQGSIVQTLINWTNESNKLHLNKKGVAQLGSSSAIAVTSDTMRNTNNNTTTTTNNNINPTPGKVVFENSPGNKPYAERRASLRNENK